MVLKIDQKYLYYLEASDIVDFSWQPYLTVKLKFKNKGNTDASLLLRVTVENAIILNDTVEYPHKLISESEAEFYYLATENMEHYATAEIHIIPKNNPDNFSITYVVEKRFDSSFSGMINFLFGEVKGFIQPLLHL